MFTYKQNDVMMFKRDLFYFCSVYHYVKTSFGIGPRLRQNWSTGTGTKAAELEVRGREGR